MKATQLARTMVTAYGMSPLLGQASWEPPALAHWSPAHPERYAAEVGRDIDREVRRILGEQHARVVRMLQPRTEDVRAGARALLERESLSGTELVEAIATARRGRRPAIAR